MRVATYTRISTDEENQPYSLGAQDDRLGAYIRSQEGWELVRRYTDQMSGSTLERPALQRVLNDARSGAFDLLLVYRVDRLSRSVRGLTQILEDLATAGVVFRSATEPHDTSSPAGRMSLQLLGVFAEFERATLIDRVVAGMERKASRGEWHGGKTPFGYVGDANGLAVVESEARVVRQIFSLCQVERLGSRAIANLLNEGGSRPRTGKPWGHKTILDMLRNPIYAGQIAFRGKTYPGLHPAIVEEATFKACAAILDERGEDYTRRASNPSDYLLASLMRCTKCRKRWVGTAANGRLYRYRYYTCLGRQQFGRHHGCDAPRIASDRAELQMLQATLDILRNHDGVRQALGKAAADRIAARPLVTEDLASIREEIARKEGAVRRYQLAFEDGSMPAADCGPRIQELGAQVRDLRTRVADLEDLAENQVEDEVSDEILQEIEAELEAALLGGTPAQKKAVLRKVIYEIETDGTRAWPKFRVPMPRGS